MTLQRWLITVGALLWLTYLFFAPSPYANVKEGDTCDPKHHWIYGTGPDPEEARCSWFLRSAPLRPSLELP